MNARSRKHLIAEINITPFTDVILVLLIIFMITTPLIIQSSIKVNLPQATSATPIKSDRPLNVVITNEGALYLDDALVTRKEFSNRIALRHRDNPNISVIVSSDRLVRFKDIVDVLDILNTIGVRSLNIAATTER
jgi:biopolymer transport protein ExbD